jgi:hypothetical protein
MPVILEGFGRFLVQGPLKARPIAQRLKCSYQHVYSAKQAVLLLRYPLSPVRISLSKHLVVDGSLQTLAGGGDNELWQNRKNESNRLCIPLYLCLHVFMRRRSNLRAAL